MIEAALVSCDDHLDLNMLHAELWQKRMAATWGYVKTLAQQSERWGYDLTLIAELNLNDIKGTQAPSLDGHVSS